MDLRHSVVLLTLFLLTAGAPMYDGWDRIWKNLNAETRQFMMSSTGMFREVAIYMSKKYNDTEEVIPSPQPIQENHTVDYKFEIDTSVDESIAAITGVPSWWKESLEEYIKYAIDKSLVKAMPLTAEVYEYIIVDSPSVLNRFFGLFLNQLESLKNGFKIS